MHNIEFESASSKGGVLTVTERERGKCMQLLLTNLESVILRGNCRSLFGCLLITDSHVMFGSPVRSVRGLDLL